MDYQAEKQLVLAYYELLESDPEAAMRRFCAPSLVWRGFHPLGEMQGPETVAKRFWVPLADGLRAMQRRMDVFFAGENSLNEEGSRWVVSMGHLSGLFDNPWLGIRPTGKMAFLRYAAFHRVENGRIAEEAMFFDIPHLMMQAGFTPFPPQTAAHLVQPGPRTHDGLLLERQNADEAARTLNSINAMIADLGQWQLGLPLEEELRRSWHEDMVWWGPAGIGATCTIERYAKQHAGPFRAALSERGKTSHLCRLAEGSYGGFFGWPNFKAVLSGEFMGMPATGKPGEFRVIDIYRRADDKLAENWVFIDLLHFWWQQGIDILAQAIDLGSRDLRR